MCTVVYMWVYLFICECFGVDIYTIHVSCTSDNPIISVGTGGFVKRSDSQIPTSTLRSQFKYILKMRGILLLSPNGSCSFAWVYFFFFEISFEIWQDWSSYYYANRNSKVWPRSLPPWPYDNFSIFYSPAFNYKMFHFHKESKADNAGRHNELDINMF